MPDREFRIKIITEAAPQGAQATTAAMGDLTAKAGASGHAMDEASGHVDKLELSHKNLHKIIHALNGSVPGLGILLQGAFSPVGAAVTIGVLALEHFKEQLKDINAELDKQGEEAGKPLTHHLEAVRETTVEAAVAMANYTLKLAETARGERSLNEQMARAVELQKAQIQAAGHVRESNHNEELARLEYLHKAGLVSTEEYERKKFEIELKWAQMKREMEESTLQYEMNTHTARINKAEQNQPKLAQDVNAKTTAYEQAHVTAVQAAKDRVTTEEQAKAAKDTWEKFNRDHPTHAANFERLGVNATDEQIEQDRWSHSQSYGFDWTDVGVVESYKKWRKAKIDNDQLNGRAAEDGKPAIKAAVVTSIETEARTAAAAAKAKIDLETAQKRETENKAFVVSGRQDVAAKDDQLAALQAQNAQIKAVEEAVLKQQRQTTQLDSPSMGTIMRAFDELRAGHRDPQARQVEADAENILHHMGYTDLQIGNMIRQILKSVQDRDRVIDDLQKQVERLNQRY